MATIERSPSKQTCVARERTSLIGKSRRCYARVRRREAALLCTDRRHDRYDLLLASDDFDDEAFAIEVALLIKADVEQHAGVVLGGYFRAMQRGSQRLAIEFADRLRHRLDDVDGAVPFRPIVIGSLLVFRQIL